MPKISGIAAGVSALRTELSTISVQKCDATFTDLRAVLVVGYSVRLADPARPVCAVLRQDWDRIVTESDTRAPCLTSLVWPCYFRL